MDRFGKTTGFLIFTIVAVTSEPASSSPAARVGDSHVCPQRTGQTLHVGGPVMKPGVPNVLICGKPAAVVGNPVQCNGPLGAVPGNSWIISIA